MDIPVDTNELRQFTDSVRKEFGDRHDALLAQVRDYQKESAKREQETLDSVRQIHGDIVTYLSEIDARSAQRTAIVRRSNALTNRTSKYVVQVIVTVAILGFLWSQISETQRRNWANLSFPLVGVSAMILLGLPIAQARRTLENAEFPNPDTRSNPPTDSSH